MNTRAVAREARYESEIQNALARLEADGLVERTGELWKTRRRWQQAMARAAAKLYAEGDSGDDLRTPIALALVELYGDSLDDEVLAGLIEAMLPIELISLGLGPR